MTLSHLLKTPPWLMNLVLSLKCYTGRDDSRQGSRRLHGPGRHHRIRDRRKLEPDSEH